MQYFILVVTLGLSVLTLGVLGFVYGESVVSSLKEELTYGIKNHYNASTDSGISLAWDHIQNEVLIQAVTFE